MLRARQFSEDSLHYQEEKGFYWKYDHCSGIEDCREARKYLVHFSFLPRYRNFDDSTVDPYEGAICPHDVRMFFIMMKCQTVWDKDPSVCHPSELYQENKISLNDIGNTQSGIINGAVYHQIYCVSFTLHPTTINPRECSD